MTADIRDEQPAWYQFVDPQMQHGDSGKFAVRLASVTLAGTEIKLTGPGVTAIVGGNNVGKSTLLRELGTQLSNNDPAILRSHLLLESLRVERDGSSADFLAWLDKHFPYGVSYYDGAPHVRGFFSGGDATDPSTLARYWASFENRTNLGDLSRYLVHSMDAASRMQIISPVLRRERFESPASHPLYKLEDDSELMDEFREICWRIFRKSLTIDQLSGKVNLRVGTPGVEAPRLDDITREYRDALASLPTLMSQGDGMRSLLGLLLPIMTATYPIILIDEPEAFLHPPQAFELGKELASIARSRGIQVILATHDRNLLIGLVSGGVDVSVIRLEREESGATAAQLDSSLVSSLWSDPVLRYSNVFDGLFHRLVVVAEADRDCRFYSAAVDAANDLEALPYPPSEVHFVPANGKDGLKKIVRALRAVGVNVVCTPDLDILNDRNAIRALVEESGGRWEDFESDYAAATNSFRNQPINATIGEVLRSIDEKFRERLGDAWTDDVSTEVRPLMRTSKSTWSHLKEYGMKAFKGESRNRAQVLIEKLAAIGIFCVREGELEGVAPNVAARKGAAWLHEAFSQEAHKGDEALAHVRWIIQGASASVVDAEPQARQE